MRRWRSGRRPGQACALAGFMLLGLAMTGPDDATAQTLTRERVAAALPALDALAQRAIEAGAVPGLAVAVVFEDEVMLLKGYGLRAVGKPERVGAETVFQIASLSKAVTSTVVAALVGDGILGFDSRIADLDPPFQLHDAYPTAQVTVRDLLNHRSGLPGNAGNDLEAIGYGRAAILRRLRLVPPASSFRAGYSYSNFGFTEGALAAAQPTGKSWEAIARDKLFDPLGMNATSTTYADFLTRADRAALHVRAGGAWAAKLERDPDAQAPAGGVSANVRDLARWVRLELGNGTFEGRRVVGASALAETHVPLMARGSNPVTGAAAFYGLGWNVEYGRHGLVWGHAGAFSVGAQTLVSLHPASRLGIVVLTNAFPSGVPEGLADSLADLAFDGRVGRDWVTAWGAAYEALFAPAIAASKAAYAAPPADATPPLPLAAYAGQYANAYVGPAAVRAANGVLTVSLGPDGARTYPLRHFDRDLFVYFPDAEVPDTPSAIRFAVGHDGRARTMTVEPLDADGLGTLERVP